MFKRLLSKSNEASLLADKMKSLEKYYEKLLIPDVPFIVRLDGVAFRTYTKKMKKPFDDRLTNSLISTSKDLMEKTKALLCFCQSDEISLVFGRDSLEQMMYGGRTLKISSVIASMASARFNYYMGLSDQSDGAVEPGAAYFDARVFSAPDEQTAMEAIYWRHKYDLRRNAINSIGAAHFSQKHLENVTLKELQKKLHDEKNVTLSQFRKVNLLGTFFKKKIVEHMGFNPKTNENVPTLRSKVESRVFDWEGTAEERTLMTLRKHWEDNDPKSLE